MIGLDPKLKKIKDEPNACFDLIVSGNKVWICSAE